MRENKELYLDMSINDLCYPISVVSRNDPNGQKTISLITVEARIGMGNENDFENKILEIINKRNSYIGANQLITLIINYINSLNASALQIELKYPYFLERSIFTNCKKQLKKYNCSYSIHKSSQSDYEKKYEVEIPLPVPLGFLATSKEKSEAPLTVSVQIEGLETYFMEDLIEIVEGIFQTNIYYSIPGVVRETTLNNSNENFDTSFIESVKNEIISKFSINKCTVKLTNHKSQYTFTKRILSDRAKRRNDNEFEHYHTEHLFI